MSDVKIEKTVNIDKTINKVKPKVIKKHSLLGKILFFVILFLVLALVGIAVYLGFTTSVENIQYKYKIYIIEKKILYLITENKQVNVLEKYYKEAESITLTEAIKDLSFNIEKNCREFDISTDLLISLINNESRFAKFARSQIEIKDEYGRLIRTDQAFGYCQIYLRVWQDIIPIDADILFSSYENTYWGVYVLKHFLIKNNNDLFSAIVNYNGGYKKSDEKYTTINTITFNYICKIINDKNKLENYQSKFDIVEFLKFYFL
jgi:hypothetical protein